VLSGEPDLFEDGRPVEVLGYTDGLLAERAVRFIERTAAAGEPFFLYVPWLLPHYPLQSPDDPAIAPVGDRPTYAAMVEYLDAQVGRILEALRDAGVERDTLVVFTSDNGGHPTARNVPFGGGKRDLHEGGIRVPLFLRWPGVIPEGVRISAPVVTMDLGVTILAAAGLGSEAAGMDGVDLLPWLTGTAEPAPRPLFWRLRRVAPRRGVDEVRARAVREDGWKLLVGDDGARLYHLPEDPGERRDLAAQEPERVARLRERLAAWEREVGD
jgi:arylsulfatase A-like enzyme